MNTPANTNHGHHARPVWDTDRPDHLGEIRLSIASDADIVASRDQGRTYACRSGLSTGEATIVATVISEMARYILSQGGHGEVALAMVRSNGRRGVRVTAHQDRGRSPDHPEPLSQCLRDLETRLDGIKQLMDEFEIVSDAGRGTIVALTKWSG